MCISQQLQIDMLWVLWPVAALLIGMLMFWLGRATKECA